MDLLHKIGAAIASGLVALAGFFGGTPAAPAAPVDNTLGASNAIESPVALFETSLANSISSSATSMTLVSALTKDGTTLASSTYSFILDEGTASEEFVIADCTGTSCSNMQRGLSVITGTTTVASLQKAHRRGASVKITDAPILLKIGRIVNGVGTFPNIISYTSHPTFTATTNIIDKKYVDDTAFSGAGVIDATNAARGVSELSTQAEAAAGTTNGSSGVLVLPASIATSTHNTATAVNRVLVSNGSGYLDENWLSPTFANAYTHSATSTYTATSSLVVGSFSVYDGAFKNMWSSTSAGTTTFSVPSGVSRFWITVCGAGGGGGGTSGSTATGQGGGAGGCAFKNLTLTGTTTVQVHVGTHGTGGPTSSNPGGTGEWSTFGTNGFYMSATGGTGGAINAGAPGSGGSGTNGDLNVSGMRGGNGNTVSGGYGGTGAPSANWGGNWCGAGGIGANYGSASTGGDASDGCVIIRW